MKTQTLIEITRVADSDIDPASVGSLDYAIPSSLAGWLAFNVEGRRAALVAEMRALADALERGDSPFVVTLESARARAAENAAKRTLVAEKQTGHLIGGPPTRDVRCGTSSVAQQQYASVAGAATTKTPIEAGNCATCGKSANECSGLHEVYWR